MRIWTIQDKRLLEQLNAEGVAYCNPGKGGENLACTCSEDWTRAYDWLAERMKARIGNPPVAGITYPMWAWCSRSQMRRDCRTSTELDGKVLICADIPDDSIVLSDLYRWGNIICGCPARDDESIGHQLERWYCTGEHDVPEDLQREIEGTWDSVFDLGLTDSVSPDPEGGKPLQGTFWLLRKEWVVSVKKFGILQVAWPKLKMKISNWWLDLTVRPLKQTE